MNFVDFFTTIGGLASANVIISDWINKSLKIEKGWAKQTISWIVPILVSVFGLVLSLGIFASFGSLASWTTWVYAILTGFGTGLVSNGIYDISSVKVLLNNLTELFAKYLPKKEPEVQLLEE